MEKAIQEILASEKDNPLRMTLEFMAGARAHDN